MRCLLDLEPPILLPRLSYLNYNQFGENLVSRGVSLKHFPLSLRLTYTELQKLLNNIVKCNTYIFSRLDLATKLEILHE